MEDKKYDYKELKNSFQIVLEIKNYILLNNKDVLIKNENGELEKAEENDEFAETLRKYTNDPKVRYYIDKNFKNNDIER